MKTTLAKYEESIVNLMASLYKSYGGKPEYQTIKSLDQILAKEHKHVVLLVFDGLGYAALNAHLDENSLLKKKLLKPIQSVFPPTTTAAMTSYYTGLSPYEHGWLGWSLYFKEYASSIDIFTNLNSYTGESMPVERIAYEALPYISIYEKMKDVCPRLKINTIKPRSIYFPEGANKHHKVKSLEKMMQVIQYICSTEEQSFTAAYWPDPDMKMHEFGPYDLKVKEVFEDIDHKVNQMVKTLKNTLVIVCADHGLTEIKGEINIRDYSSIMDCLYMPPSIEGRAMSFWVKPKKVTKFEGLFKEHFEEDFILFSKEEVRQRQLFGHFKEHQRFDDFVGDYLACATSSKLMYYKTNKGKEPHHFKGHHAGLTDEEMIIPLIVIEC